MAPSAPVFLSHYTIRVGKKVGWVSLAPLPNTSLFTAYTASYKGFKDRFLKIRALDEGSLCTDRQPRNAQEPTFPGRENNSSTIGRAAQGDELQGDSCLGHWEEACLPFKKND
ncbi:hypothetical protein CR513_55020, partial [Mucuna pruriens]